MISYALAAGTAGSSSKLGHMTKKMFKCDKLLAFSYKDYQIVVKNVITSN